MPPAEPPVVGVLALQGDVAEHLRAPEQAGARPLAVRRPAELDKAAELIIPGGKSTTIGKLAEMRSPGFTIAATLPA
jgi:5'-phosphate synthase pdxT subunit